MQDETIAGRVQKRIAKHGGHGTMPPGVVGALLLLGIAYALVSEIGVDSLGLGVVVLGWTGSVGRRSGRSAWSAGSSCCAAR